MAVEVYFDGCRNTASAVRVETSLPGAGQPTGMLQSDLIGVLQSDLVGEFFDDPVLVGMMVLMLVFVFFSYLFIRRTITGFMQGLNEGRDQP
jgi:hypothetical protein